MSDVAVPGVTAEQVRGSVERTKRGLEAAAAEIVWQISVRAWEPLGYESWDEMREAEYSGAAVIVPRADRPQLSARLAAEGLSQKQIGETLGVNQATVSRDLSDVMQTHNEVQPMTRTDALGREQPRVKARRDPDPEPEPEPTHPEHEEKRPDPEPGIWYSGPTKPVPEPDEHAEDDARRDAELNAALEGTVQRFRANFARASVRAGEVTTFDADRIAEVFAANWTRDVGDLLWRLREWCDAVESAHRRQSSGLRVIRSNP